MLELADEMPFFDFSDGVAMHESIREYDPNSPPVNPSYTKIPIDSITTGMCIPIFGLREAMLSTGSYYLCHVKANSLIQVTELTREFLYVEVIRDTHATYQSDLIDSGRSQSAQQQIDLNQTPPDAVDASQASQSSKESQSQGITSINAVQTIDVNKDSSSTKIKFFFFDQYSRSRISKI